VFAVKNLKRQGNMRDLFVFLAGISLMKWTKFSS